MSIVVVGTSFDGSGRGRGVLHDPSVVDGSWESDVIDASGWFEIDMAQKCGEVLNEDLRVGDRQPVKGDARGRRCCTR